MSAVIHLHSFQHQQNCAVRIPPAWRFLASAPYIGRFEKFEAGEEVVGQNDAGSALRVIVSGAVTAQTVVHNEPRLFAYLGVGMAVGSEALVREQAEPYTVVAQEPTEFFVLDAADFYELYEREARLREICAHLVHAFATSGNHIVSLEPHIDPETGVMLRFERPGDYAITSAWTYGWGTIEVHCQIPEGQATRELVFQNATIGKGRVIRLLGDRVVGVTVTGGWPDLIRLHELMLWNARLRPWQRALFRTEGELYRPHDEDTRSDLAVICRCANVRRGELRCAVAHGATTVAELAVATGASRVCGSCAPALNEVIGVQTEWQQAEKLEVVRMSHDVLALRLFIPGGFEAAHQPGQYLPVEAFVHGEWVRRNYTITSAPGEAFYEICVKAVPDGVFSRWVHERMRPESTLRFSSPKGDFLMPNRPETVVFYAGGIGVTPAIAHLRKLIAERFRGRYILDYSARSQADFTAADELLEWAGNEERVEVRLRNAETEGFITDEDVSGYVERYPEAHHYLCGPAPFMATVEAGLAVNDVPRERVRKEHFLPPGSRRRPRVSMPRFSILTSVLAMLALALWFIQPAVPMAASVAADFDPAVFWYDGLFKQISGFSVLFLAILISLISARKRLRPVRFGQFNHWRLLHLGTGVLILALLAVHTGMSLGEGLSMALLMTLLAGALLGGMTGVATLMDSRRPGKRHESMRRGFNLAHLIVLSPLPVLLTFHVVSVYYF